MELNKKIKKEFSILLLIFIFLISNFESVFSQGPNSPEAASFEPVDATDMVNLLTGDFTYVLPLLNIPSPEGGYPIALSYHAGIALDQEASWVGLGWNINPGAINRNVNGYPDDYFSAINSDYFFSKEETITQFSTSIGFGFKTGVSVGLGLSWGSNKSLGGTVSVGYGNKIVGANLSAGTNGIGIGAQYTLPSGLSFGANVYSNGSSNISIGINNNGSGFSISSNGTLDLKITSQNKSSTTNLSLSSKGVGISVRGYNTESNEDENGNITYSRVGGGGGLGINFSFNTIAKMGDYTTSSNSWSMPFFIPIGTGILNLSFGKSKFKYSLNKFNKNYLSGPVHFNKASGYKVFVKGIIDYPILYLYRGSIPFNYTQQELFALTNGLEYRLEKVNKASTLDILELPIINSDIEEETNLMSPNLSLPNYDKFNVQAQGLSGAITSRVLENGALFGFSDKTSIDGDKLDYLVNNDTGIPQNSRFNKKTNFYFENEISTYLETPINNLYILNPNNNIITSNLGTIYSPNILNENKSENVIKRKTANFIEYFTNNEIVNNFELVKSKGYLNPVARGFNRPFYPSTSLGLDYIGAEGIGAFKITAIDGKTYHYSIPVYNHEIIQRTYGVVKDQSGNIKPESDAYFEKKQLVPFATHWLLTTVTGSDFIDVNNNGIADNEDYGYWVNFEYGKYSDAFVWSLPYGKDVIVSTDDENSKTWIKGRKELYYLDKIRTRTHTALFIKSKREDGKSSELNYNIAYPMYNGANNFTGFGYKNEFIIPKQNPLKLDKIILIKGDYWGMGSGNITRKELDIQYNQSYIDEYGNLFQETLKKSILLFDNLNNVIDKDDNFESLNGKIIKSIVFDTDYSLVKGTPNSDTNGRLTLKSVSFNGKNEISSLPPYKFSYINSSYNFNINDKDDFGYKENQNELWSLNLITTPTGQKIDIKYAPHKLKSVIKSKINFIKYGNYTSTAHNLNQFFLPNNYRIKIHNGSNFGIVLGQKVKIDYEYFSCTLNGYLITKYLGYGTIQNYLGNDEYDIIPDEVGVSNFINPNTCSSEPDDPEINLNITYEVNNNPIITGGIRVKSVTNITEDEKCFSINYKYGGEGVGLDFGYVTYLPYAPELEKELPYSSELPPPKVMYDRVTTNTTYGSNINEKVLFGLKTEYNFNILKEKTEGLAKFGDFYEISKNQSYGDENSNLQLYNFLVKDNLGTIGQLISVKTFNLNDQLLGMIENNYYNQGETPNKLGVLQESYHLFKKITDKNNNVKNFGITSTKITYPNLLKNSTEYKMNNKFTSEFNDLDAITGQATEVYSYSSQGLKFKTKNIQAFRKYEGMGSKVDNPDNKNMLSQSAASYSYIIDPITGNENLYNIGITTWNKNWVYKFNDNTTESINDTWRKHKSYIWKGNIDSNGLYLNFIDNFNWSINATSQTSEWQLITEITKYDQFSNVLEIRDINKNYISTKMGGNDYSKVIVKSNALYDEMYYSGAEYHNEKTALITSDNPFDPHIYLETIPSTHFDGGVKSFGRLKSESSHTGDYMVSIGTGQNAFEVKIPARSDRNTPRKQKFKVSVWVKTSQKDNVAINVGGIIKSFNINETQVAGDWSLLNGYIDIPPQETIVSLSSTNGTIQLDDFRLHPITSSMTSYVYNEFDEVSYIIGSNGLATNYIYDAAGRLKETKVEILDNPSAGIIGGFKTVSKNSYNYKNQ